jgi:hypothetical protein
MLVVESMDADTFSRRVATVGLEAGGYMDLFEGGGDFTEKSLTPGWVVYGKRRHAEPPEEDVPPQLYPW